MSDNHFTASPFAPRAEQAHPCNSCGLLIEKGDIYYHITDPDGDDHIRDHLDCILAAVFLTELYFGGDEPVTVMTIEELLSADGHRAKTTLIEKFPGVAARLGITPKHTAN